MTEVKLVEQFVTQVIANSSYTELDRIYLTNCVLALVGDSVLNKTTTKTELIDLKDELVAAAQDNGRCGKIINEQDMLGAQLMNLIVPCPSSVNRQFWQTYQEDPHKAITDFYQLSKKSDYIKTRSIAKNIYFVTPSEYGDLEITINLSKPEKDPRLIAAAKKVTATGYPLCQLCMENEGYLGRINYPARSNHRIIRLKLGDEVWGFQYSPYAYCNEHCIFLAPQHREMKITQATFERLLSIIEKFPGYFVGSNADLPIVGGSILTHDHYQGGRHTFAMAKAKVMTKLEFAGFNDVVAGIVKWPMSVIRLRSHNKKHLVALATKILRKWRSYSDEQVNVRAFTDEIPHHTVTPIARKRDNQLELDLVLRDNQTSAEYPTGIFHPHKDVQHIKKENIGFIEVMGLAILPPRLKTELHEVKKFLLDEDNQIAAIHLPWAQKIKVGRHVTKANVDIVIQSELGKVFVRILEDAGVFKQTKSGQAAFMRFVKSVGLKINVES